MENSTIEYLTNLSQQGTTLFNLSQILRESNQLSVEINVTCTGHIDVSTGPFNFVPISVTSNTVLLTAQTNSTLSKENDLRKSSHHDNTATRNGFLQAFNNTLLHIYVVAYVYVVS